MSINNLILLGLLILAVFVGWFIYDSTQPSEPHTPYPYTIVSASNMIYLLDKRSGATWYRGGGFKWRPFTFEPSTQSASNQAPKAVSAKPTGFDPSLPSKVIDLTSFDPDEEKFTPIPAE